MLLFLQFLMIADVTVAFPKLSGSNLLPWKRHVFEERPAPAQPTCSCNTVDPDPAAVAFVGHLPFAAAASAAPTPQGYVNVFTNEHTYCGAEGGLGFTLLDAYESELCASLCESLEGCAAFTLYYEKDGSNYRGTDVQSSAVIKCAFWAGSLSPSGSSGRRSEAYNAIIAGSNGYTNKIITLSAGFGSAHYLGGAAIDCPEGSAEAESFISSKNVGTGAFDANRCVDLCHSVTCQFFNTYMLNKNGESVGQFCDMYTAPIPASYATNVGKRDGEHNYTISSSYTFVNGPLHYGEPEAVPSAAWTVSLSHSASLHPDPHQSTLTASPASSGWSGPQCGHGSPQGAVSPTIISSESSNSSSLHDPWIATSTTSAQSWSGAVAPRPSTSTNSGHSRNSSRPSEQSTVVIFSTQTVMPLPVTQSTWSSMVRNYTDSQTLLLTSSPSNSSSMTTDLSQNPGDATYYSTTSSSSNPSPTTNLISTPAHPTMSSSSTTLGVDQVKPSTSTNPIPDTDPAYPSTSVSPTLDPSPQNPPTSINPTSDPVAVRPSPSLSPTSSSNPRHPSATLPGTYAHSVTTTSELLSTSNYSRSYDLSSSSKSSLGRLYLTSTSSISNTGPWSSGSRMTASSSAPSFSSSTTSLVIDPAEIAQITTSTAETSTPTDEASFSNTTGNYSGSPSGYKFSNSTDYPVGYNTSVSFNMTHMIHFPSNNSWYCELTHQWYAANGNLSLSGFNFTLPSYNVTSETTNFTMFSVVPDPKSTQSSSTSSSTATIPSSTASNPTGTTFSSHNSSGSWSVTSFNSSHLTYSASNNSIFCTITGLWYPAGNFSLASLNITGNYTMNPNYSLNYTMLSNTTNSAITSVLPPLTSASSEMSSSTPAPENTTIPLNTTGTAYPSVNYSIPFNASHMIYLPSNNSFYCELTHLWYPAGNVSNIPGFNISAYPIFNGTLPSYNYTLLSNTTTTTSTSTTFSTSQTPTATPSPDNSTTETNATSGYNSTGIFPTSFNAPASNASHLHFTANGSLYCDITQRWYLPNDTSWRSLLNITYPSFNASAYGSNSTYGTNSTSTNTTVAASPTAPTIGSIPGDASVFYVTVNPTSALRRRTIEYLGFSGPESVIVESSSQASRFYIVNGFMLDAGNSDYVGTEITDESVTIREFSDSRKVSNNWEVFGSTLSLKGATFCCTADETLFVVSSDVSSPGGCTTVVLGSIPVSSTTSTGSGTPTPTPAPSVNVTFANSTRVFPTYNATYSVPLFNGSNFNSSHLIYATNGSVYCEITQKWYLSNDTSWMALLNSTYPSFNASAYGGYNRTSYSPNSTLTNTTDLNATSTSSSSSILGTPTLTTASGVSSDAASANSTGTYPQHNSTISSFNASALNSTDHLTYFANGSVFCDYTQKLYPANDTSWTSLMNYTSSGYNSSAYAGFNSTAYSLNSTGANATSTTSSSVEQTATATPEPVANITASTTNSTTMANSTGVFPQYNTTISSFNASAVNSTDHLIFYANGTVWCDYTHELYPANDTSWMSWPNATRSGFNTSAYGGLNSTGFNSTGYSYNTTSLNSTTYIADATSTNLTTSADPADPSTSTPTPDPLANSTDPVSNTTTASNSSDILPSYNGTLYGQLNSSVLNSTGHLIFYANGSVFCDYTQQLYPFNDTSWVKATYAYLNSTGSSYNATNYSSSYNATALNSTTAVGNSTTAEPSPVSTTPSNSDTPASLANGTAPSNATTSINTGVFPSFNTSTAINSTDHLIFFSNGSVYCENTRQLYPANDTGWLNATVTSSYAYPMTNSTAAGYYYAPANLTAAGLGYSDASPSSTGGDVPTPSSNTALAPAASSTGYLPSTDGNGTVVDGNSTVTEGDESTGPERKVRRWKAPRERAGLR